MSLPSRGSSSLPPSFLAGPVEQRRLTGRAALAVVLFGTSLLLVKLGGNRVISYHEGVFCEPAREMLATGDWLIPRIGGVPFLEKPPMTAWIVAGAMRLSGSRSEWVVRLPSVVSANITALAIALLAGRWFGSRIGMLAGMIQFTVYYTLQLSRLAECDTHFVAAVAVAMCSFAVANVDSPRGRSTARWLPWTFSLAAGLSFLIKGPLGPGIIFSGCGLFLLVSQDLRSLRFFFSPLGLALFALCVLPYPLLAYAAHPPLLDVWLLHNVGRFQGELQGQKIPFYYLLYLPMVTAPWFPLIPLYLWRRRGQGLLVEPLWRFVICWMIPGFTVFSLSAFKKHHYIAPLLPGLSIFLAVALVDFLQRRHRGERLHNGLFCLATTTACVLGIGAVGLFQPRGAAAICWLLAGLAVCVLVMAWLESQRRFSAHLAALMATCWLLIAVAFLYILPHHNKYLDQSRLAKRINQLAPAGKPLYMLGLIDCQITYYLDQPIVRVDQPRNFLNRLPANVPGDYYVLAPGRTAAMLKDAGAVHVLDECESVISYMHPDDRLTFLRLERSADQLAQRSALGTEPPNRQ